jgi:predicted HicB family RNase H-like nuclease
VARDFIADGNDRRKRRMKMFSDPIVEEVHAIRAKIASECDYDLHRISERANEFMKRFEGQFNVVNKDELQRIRREEVAPTDK